jgi:methyl-accepting chemotaxis protein
MKLRTELLLYTMLLAALNVALAFGCIGLFVRMGPAIARIMQANVLSMDAAERIVFEFAANGASFAPEPRLRVAAEMEKIGTNITEKGEAEVFGLIRASMELAMEGDPQARAAALGQLRRLIAINREAMTAVDLEARRLGSAGAWAAVFVGSISFALGLLIVAQLRRRLLRPVLEIHDVLAAAHNGDRFRRCKLLDAPIEIRKAAESVNRLLDERPVY